MTLTSKFLFWSAVLLIPTLMLGGMSVWNLTTQARAVNAATAEYEVTDRSSALAVQVAWLRDSLRTDPATYHDVKYFAPIQSEVRGILDQIKTAAATDDGDSRAELELAGAIPAHLNQALDRVNDSAMTVPAGSTAAAVQLDELHKSLMAASSLAPSAARRHVIAMSTGIYQRLGWTCFWLLLVLVVSAVVHFKQYRMLVRPLIWLRDEMRKSAAGEYREPVHTDGDGEFKDVAVYFNGLAKELSELYRNLEEKVIARSRELVRSERLASVGFLAAGVAHEINNPLSVISGYAELAVKSMQRMLGAAGSDHETNALAEAEALSSALEAQGIIREEAFRCKEITSRLLSLARGGNDNREPLSLHVVAQQVVALTKGLRNYRDRKVILDFAANDSLEVVANSTEMKQVLLNLTVNALEAIPNERGEVHIGGNHSGEWVELYVEDNGKGMTPAMLEQIFEPFFTAKRGAGEPGTGLGLSITHAIIENHGGRIRAESAGPGRGSRFTFRLPAREKMRNGQPHAVLTAN